jgi:septum formation protein
MINKKLILASKSPRRQQLIQGLGIPYTICTYEVDEQFPQHLQAEEIPLYLAQKKAEAYPLELNEHEVLVTADTIVWINNHVLNKPENKAEALNMLKEICATTHQVYTGVVLKNNTQHQAFFEQTEVQIKQLEESEMLHYINVYKPYDKAGGYGIQDWFGYVAVEKVNGCFYNVMGLPVSKLYQHLKQLC